MATFLMFGNYSSGPIKDVSPGRTTKAKSLIKKHGGKTKTIYALLGGHDLVLIVDLPSIESAMKVSIELNGLTGIDFHTVPAVEVKEFDKFAAGVRWVRVSG